MTKKLEKRIEDIEEWIEQVDYCLGKLLDAMTDTYTLKGIKSASEYSRKQIKKPSKAKLKHSDYGVE